MKMTEREAMDQYDEMLNEQGTIKIGTLEYSPADVLRVVDPTVYRCGLVDYIDSLADDGLYVEGYTEDPDEEDGNED